MPLKQVEGLIMAARPESPRPDELRPTFTLPGGVVVSGRWKDLDTSVWKIESAWGQALNLPAAEIQGVRFGGGKMTYLSDLTPEQGRGNPLLRPSAPLAPQCQPAGRAAADERARPTIAAWPSTRGAS